MILIDEQGITIKSDRQILKESGRLAHHRPKKTQAEANRLANLLKAKGYEVEVHHFRDGWWVLTKEPMAEMPEEK